MECIRIGITALLIFGIQATTSLKTVQAQVPTPDHVWQIRPGSPEWKEFKTHDQMVEALQLSQDDLKTTSTRELAAIVLNYPMLGDFAAYSSIQMGFDALASQFNALDELGTRSDAGSELLSIYQALPVSLNDQEDDLTVQGRYLAQIALLEVILAQDAIMHGLSKEELTLLRATVTRNLRIKRANIRGQSTLSNSSTAFLLARVLRTEGSNGFAREVEGSSELERLVTTSSFVSGDTIDLLLQIESETR